MLYRPKFCCECGEKVERLTWKFWTNRRFCEVCEAELKLNDILPKLGIAACLVLGIFGIGSYLRNGEQPPKIIKHSFASERGVPSAAKKAETATTSGSNAATPANVTMRAADGNKPSGPMQSRAEAPGQVYYCGAATKKGRPCSRRVKGNIRCWQHTGMPPMQGSGPAGSAH